ncbi:MAG: hypothetical protein ACPHOG_12185 [Verrucomicrobiales bacterium]
MPESLKVINSRRLSSSWWWFAAATIAIVLFSPLTVILSSFLKDLEKAGR